MTPTATTPDRPNRSRRWVVDLDPEIESEVRTIAGHFMLSVPEFVNDLLRRAIREQAHNVIEAMRSAAK